jgi:hypothetical protein
MRWVSVYSDSWAALSAELVAMLVVRAALTALMVNLAWPAYLARPRAKRLFMRAVVATALAAVLLSPSVVLLFGLAVVPVSWLFFAAVPTALLVALVLHPAAVSGDWWWRLVAPRAVGWVALAFVGLSASSAATAALPVVLAPLVAVLSGVFNAWCWVGLVQAVADRQPARHHVPVAAIAALCVIGLVVGGTVAGFTAARKAVASSAGAAPPRSRPGAKAAVLVVSGYGSSWDGANVHPFPGDFTEERFSYRGLSPMGVPLPYTGADTAKSILELDQMLLAQVASLHHRTGLAVDVVAESEGALIAKTALLADRGSPVANLVLASPLESPGRVWYPTTGDQGWGLASDQAMRMIGDAFQGVAPIDLSPGNPFFASLDGQALVLQNAMACPIRGTHQLALLPLADATVAPVSYDLAFPSVVLPAFHGGLLESPAGDRIVSLALQGRAVTDDQLLVLADEVIRYASSAWQVPPLVASDYPPTEPGASGGPTDCARVATELRAALQR